MIDSSSFSSSFSSPNKIKTASMSMRRIFSGVRFVILAPILLFQFSTNAETTNALSDAEIQGRAFVQKILAQQPTEGFTNVGVLKVEDSKRPSREISVRFITKVRPTNWVSIFEAIDAKNNVQDKLSVLHSLAETNSYAVAHWCQPGMTFRQLDICRLEPLNNDDSTSVPFCFSDFLACDLGLEFFHWPQQKILKQEFHRQCSCTVLESANPNPTTNSYSRIVSWIDQESLGIVEAYAYDVNGKKLKNFYPKNIEKINGQYQVQSLIMENLQTGSRSRLDFDFKK